jgi:hypothetical protein
VEKWLGLELGGLKSPATKNINRSMTRSELRFQKALNTVLGKSGYLVSDELCNTLPDVRSEAALPGVKEQEEMLERLSRTCEYVNEFVAPEHRYQLNVLPIDEPDGGLNHYDFTGEQIDVISKSLGREIQKSRKREARNDIAELPNVENKNHAPVLKMVRSKFDKDPADVMRDMALCFEAAGEIEMAQHLMNFALEARPRGKLIQKKVKQYASSLRVGKD